MVHILLLLGLPLLVAAIKGLYPYLLARRWRPASAKVISISEGWVDVPMRFKPLRHYYPKVKYEYAINGMVFQSNRASFEKENIWQPEVDSWGVPNKKDKFFWANWGNGTVIGIYVKPGNPHESVIVRDLNRKRRSHHLATMSGGVLIASLWGLLIVCV
jgi:hypothetical protein